MNCTSANLVTSDHVVQFFDSDESRAERVAHFLAEGYRQGEPLVVVARPVVWPVVIERLQHLGVNPNQAAAEGMLVVKNADDTLRRISRGGLPDPDLFQETVGRAMSVWATALLTNHSKIRLVLGRVIADTPLEPEGNR